MSERFSIQTFPWEQHNIKHTEVILKLSAVVYFYFLLQYIHEKAWFFDIPVVAAFLKAPFDSWLNV